MSLTYNTVSLLLIIHFVNASFDFDCNGTTKQCICTKKSCNQICIDSNQCKNYEFHCSNSSYSCSVWCLQHNSCKNSKFYLESSFSHIRCRDMGSCKNILFECKSRNECVLESDEFSFIQSQFICNGIDKYTNECRFNLLNSTTYGMLSCLLNNSIDNIQCTDNNQKISCLKSNICTTHINCIGSLCDKDSYLSMLPDINIEINDTFLIKGDDLECKCKVCNDDNNILSDINIWILTIISIIILSISCILFYYCSPLFKQKNSIYKTEKDIICKYVKNAHEEIEKPKSRNQIVGGDVEDIDKKTEREMSEPETTQEKRGESGGVKVFESSFWLTILSTLFNDDDKADGIDCGIILIPNGIDCSIILNRLECIQCKVPVTEQFLKHYGKTSKKPNSYILIQNGYIYAYEIYNNKNNLLYNAHNTHTLIIIDSQKKTTQKHNNSYYRIFVNNLRVKSADQFCNVLMNQHGIDINLKTDDTTSLKLRESLELSSTFFETKAEGMAATNLANSLHYLQERRTHRTNAEMVGATIVVIPYNKTLADYKLYLRQYLSVSMEVSDSSLLCIFSHNSVLHDGAIFVRGNTIIAVKAFFRITGQYKKSKVSIGHGTRHASAQEFSKHAKIHNPITFVLSEEDGQIRSCIAGEIKKINNKFIARLVVEHMFEHKPPNILETKSNNEKDNNNTIININTGSTQ